MSRLKKSMAKDASPVKISLSPIDLHSSSTGAHCLVSHFCLFVLFFCFLYVRRLSRTRPPLKARCKSLPKRPRHGMVIAPRMEHGSRALYKCKDGFQLGGSNVTECNYGNWSGLPPACQESNAHTSIFSFNFSQHKRDRFHDAF